MSPRGSIAASMLALGTKKRDRQAFEDALDRLRAKLSIAGGETETSVRGQTVRTHLPDLLRLTAEALREPAFPATEFEKLKRERLTALEEQKTDPQTIAERALQRWNNPYPKGDVRYVPTFDEEVAEIKGAKLDDVKRFYARFVGGASAELAIVGDFDPAAMKTLVTELFGGWKSPSPFARVPNPYRAPAPTVLTAQTPDKANATMFGRVALKINDQSDDLPALIVVDRMLGASTESRIPGSRPRKGRPELRDPDVARAELVRGELAAQPVRDFRAAESRAASQGDRRGACACAEGRLHRGRARRRETLAAAGASHRPRARPVARERARVAGLPRPHLGLRAEDRCRHRRRHARAGERGAAQVRRPAELRVVVRGRLREGKALKAGEAYRAADLPFAVRPLTPNLGGEVSGIDLTKGVTPEVFRGIREAFLRYQVLLFPPHELPPAAQVAFARQFGEVQVHVMSMYHADGHPELFRLSNLDERGEPNGRHPDKGNARLAYGRFMAASHRPGDHHLR